MIDRDRDLIRVVNRLPRDVRDFGDESDEPVDEALVSEVSRASRPTAQQVLIMSLERLWDLRRSEWE